MGKVSIGLRGWRFDEDEVFSDDGKLRPLEEMPEDASDRISRLTALVNSPCHACWLIHGDENVEECNVARVVYGEPLSEVLLCDGHEADFVYWYRERGGDEYRGDPELQDAFHEWFVDGGRAPEDYGGIEHVRTAPEDLPDVQGPDPSVLDVELPEEKRERIDLREGEVYRGEEADRDEDADEAEDVELDDADVDLSQDYPS
ncbi:hypothetical protein BRC81_15535 [Halobacteriales archaeon QS_1_68_20]|nr:MAG: hypothetical protein BRC81_15535 [Halobacteriales archaeon QS_1_68_20]